MVKSYSETWDLLEEALADEGYSLFDLEMPIGSPHITVFVASSRGDRFPVSIDDCVKVSRRIRPLLEVEMGDLGELSLQVSSPGINRRLRKPEHFERAVGERVTLSVKDDNCPVSTLTGTLCGCDAGYATVEDEKSGKIFKVALSSVRKARVDYQFA